MARGVLDARTKAQGELQLRVLQDEIAKANKATQKSRAQRERIDALIGQLTAVDTEPAKQLLIRATKDHWDDPEVLARQVATVEREAQKLADRHFAMKVTAECLTDLGYEVEQGFETVSVEKGVGLVRRASWRGYALQIRAGANREDVAFNIVRLDSPSGSAARDFEVETEFCEDFRRFVDAAATRGLDTRLTRREPPGALALQVVQSDEAGQTTSTSRRTDAASSSEPR